MQHHVTAATRGQVPDEKRRVVARILEGAELDRVALALTLRLDVVRIEIADVLDGDATVEDGRPRDRERTAVVDHDVADATRVDLEIRLTRIGGRCAVQIGLDRDR